MNAIPASSIQVFYFTHKFDIRVTEICVRVREILISCRLDITLLNHSTVEHYNVYNSSSSSQGNINYNIITATLMSLMLRYVALRTL